MAARKPTKPRNVRRVVTTAKTPSSLSSSARRFTNRAKAHGWQRFTPSAIWAALHEKHTWVRIGQAAGIGFGLLLLLFLWYAKDLPSPNKINARISATTTKLYDRTGQHVLVEIYGDKNRSIIDFNQMPQMCKNATIAIEDKDFYKHGAFSIQGIARAFYYTVFKHDVQGGSTITQQYVKNALLTDQQSISRKIKELILSIEIEQLYNKDDILKLYLNEIPYGSTAYGIQAAAKQYFAEDAKNLTLPQCAMLAALPQAPTYYSPYGQHKDALIARQHLVLEKMAQQHYITEDQAQQAESVDVLSEIKRENPYANVYAPHFVDYVREQLESKYGVKQVNEGGLKVITTLDYDKQNMAEKAVADNMSSVRRYGGSNAALVSEDPTNGQVLTMVGSYDYADPKFGSFNVASAERQPGSSFKPITYSTLFKKNYGAGTTLYDVKTDFGGGYTPRNYNGRYNGVVSIRQAFSGSLNIPAVKSLYLGGISNALQTAKDLGITTLNAGADHYGLSLTLGTGEVKLTEMTNAYAVFPEAGQFHKQLTVLKVTDPSGKVLEDNTKTDANKPKQVLDPQIAYMVNSIISDNNARCSLGAFPCHNPLTLGSRPVAAKTGTTEDYKDAWTMGYTPHLVTGVWAGNNDNTPMTQAASIVSAPIWNEYMTAATTNDPADNFTKPAGIKTVTLDADTGKLPTAGTRHTRTDVFPSWYKPQTGNTVSGRIDKVTGKLATACTPPDAIQDVTTGTVSAEIPPSDPAYPRWQPPVAALASSLGYPTGGSNLPTESDTLHNCSDVKPTVSLSVTPTTGSTFTLNANAVSGTFPVNNYIYYFDGTEIASGGNASITYSPNSTGQHTFSVKVQDAALYSATSNTVTVNVTGGNVSINLNCGGGQCTAVVNNAPSGPLSAQISINGGAFGQTRNGSGPTATFGWSVPLHGTATVEVTDSNGDTSSKNTAF